MTDEGITAHGEVIPSPYMASNEKTPHSACMGGLFYMDDLRKEVKTEDLHQLKAYVP